MTTELTIEIAAIFDDFSRGNISDDERDEAIEAIANRGRTRRRITELVDTDTI
jgi:hypothetical protein